MPVPLNFTLPSPTELTTPLKGFNMGLQTLQNMVQAKYADQMAQADIAQKSMSNLPPLDAALMAYQRASAQYGEGHPITQQMQQNYQLMYDKENTLKNYQDVLAGAKDFSSMPDEVKRATMAAVAARGGSFPELGQGVPLGGNAQGSPSFPAPAHVQTSQAAINNAQALPMTQQQLAANQRNFGQSGMALTPQDAARLQQAGIAQPGVAPTAGQIYQQSYSPEGKANIEVDVAKQKTQAEADTKAFSEALAQSEKLSSSSQNINDLLDKFESAYGKSNYVGQNKGYVPSSFADAEHPMQKLAYMQAALRGQDLSAEQAADNAQRNIQMAMLQMSPFQRITNQELNYIGTLKPNRNMNPETLKLVLGQIRAVSSRLPEQQAFLTYAKDNNIDIHTANALWGKYLRQRPSWNAAEGKANDDYSGTWQDYVTPEAINSVKTGAIYVPNMNDPSKISAKDLKYLTRAEKQAVLDSMKQKQ